MSEKKAPFIPPNAVLAYTDGSFRPPDNAACACVLFSAKTKHVIKVARWAHRGCTINQMELMAVNYALDHASDYLVIYTDSNYVILCFTQWIKIWERNNWVNAQQEPVKNKDLILEIQAKIKKRKFVRFVKVKAHTGDPFNSMADYLAQQLTAQMVADPTITDRVEEL